jgi:hypothetical protein
MGPEPGLNKKAMKTVGIPVVYFEAKQKRKLSNPSDKGLTRKS